MTSRLCELLERELDALAESIRDAAKEATEFWNHPDVPALSVWADFPVLHEMPEPRDGSVSERALYDQLMRSVKPALESRRYGFASVPILYPHDKHYRGPAFGTHFLAAVMGGEVTFAADSERCGWNSWVKPIINDESEIANLEEFDVAKSAVLQAILTGLREMTAIVRGRIRFTHYAPTFPLDFAADVVGHERFFEWVVSNPQAAGKLIDVCVQKWIEITSLQEQAAGAKMVNDSFIPGIRLSDMILPYLSPASIRTVVLPYNANLARHYGACVAEINHRDPSLLADYLNLPSLRGLSVPVDWPMDNVVSALAGKAVFLARFTWHFHETEKPHAPICVPWPACCQQIATASRKLRVLATLAAHAPTPHDRQTHLLKDLDDLHRAWSRRGH